MKAMVLKKFGDVDNFSLEEVLIPGIKENEVLVQVMAIGINPIDVKTRAGEGIASMYSGKQPIILGWGISGTISAVGEEVKEFKKGDAVFGTINFPGLGGAYAEYVAVPAEQLALKPFSISYVDAAAATLAALTAWQALIDTGKIGKGERVLIHGGAGGVGNFAVQIAKYSGAYVVATAAGEDRDFVKASGADEVIDYKSRDFEDVTCGFDYILDTVGGENFVRSLKVLKPDGKIVLLPSDKIAEAEEAVKKYQVKHYKHILVHSDGKGTQAIADLLANGNLKVHVDRTFLFRHLPEAHMVMEKGKVRGKIVVMMQIE